VRVALITAAHLARVWLVARVHVRMLLAVAAVGEAPLTALELTPEGLLAWQRQRRDISGPGRVPGLGSSPSPAPHSSFVSCKRTTKQTFSHLFAPRLISGTPYLTQSAPPPTLLHPSPSPA
jgi:hypothetical protein